MKASLLRSWLAYQWLNNLFHKKPSCLCFECYKF
ncbi:hypothetical protein HNQ77_002499 [Silvibacterium bohemicum]|uniref:Uncharacterized protein n=1 Tax=Silvibacterium bohemicum TaxID=1577686 RepID=A0A841JVQ6_9BACT|nr:hypothetical protein [Silvibacterium bohemicum]